MDFNCTVVETSESINDNDSELNAITYTFPKGTDPEIFQPELKQFLQRS